MQEVLGYDININHFSDKKRQLSSTVAGVTDYDGSEAENRIICKKSVAMENLATQNIKFKQFY